MFDTRELGRRPGALKRASRTVLAPSGLGNEVIGVPSGAKLEVELRMESVIEGVLVTGTARAPLAGECVRCLEPLADEAEAEFQEMFAYPDADAYGGTQDTAGEAEAEEEEFLLQGDLFDLEPLLRDAIVLSLPMRPVCREDCPGLCPDCGTPLAGDPGHHHDDAVDVRWAALRELASDMREREPRDQHDEHDEHNRPPRASGDDSQER
ncbi:YceD family protein [Streptomyces sp. 6N223]|uniref:YceD family protein n=1 Tax=Streptomyces sp. 6N223 TaxID=3457412 RepID=UPI003FD2665E